MDYLWLIFLGRYWPSPAKKMMKKSTIPLSAQTIKSLRSETGFSMMDCKRALLLFDGDYCAARKALLERRRKPPESGANE